MCGLCGVFNFDGAPVPAMLLNHMLASIAHRGPDGEGRHFDHANSARGAVALGHRRLSIIDLGGGAQPMENEDGSIHVVFNGEIYNFVELRDELKLLGHEFRTSSDTEVIVHGYEEWGHSCVERFNGIFSFALWDAHTRRLFLARDHLGVKPLYYTRVGRRLLFASEIKALLCDPSVPREVNLHGLAQLLALRYVPSPETLFQGIRKLPPAHWMSVSADGIEIHPYWQKVPQIDYRSSEQELIEQYQELLEDAVRLQMRSDVPVGLFLSSGVDSGALLALMRQHTSSPIQSFTIGFEEGSQTNETNEARALANRFGTEHTEMMISARDYQDYYERYLWDLEEPVGNESAAAFHFVSKIASTRVKVALTGQGADEPWAGYPRYAGVKLSEYYSRLPRAISDGIIRPLVKHCFTGERMLRGVAALSEPALLNRFVNIYSFYDTEMKSQLLQPWLLDAIGCDPWQARESLGRIQRRVSHLPAVSQMMYIDVRANLPDDLLMVGDKTSMANSIEARVPFLDVRLIEFVESLPPQMKLRGLTGKYLHKKALERWLPREVVYRKKKGFANPVNLWLRGSMEGYLRDALLAHDSAVSRYFRRPYIERLIADHKAGRGEHLRHLYLLLSFELWHRTFMGSALPMLAASGA